MKWVEPTEVSVPREVGDAVGGHPLVARTLVRKGLLTAAEALAFLDPSHYCPSSPLDLPDMERATQRLRLAVEQREAVLVWGDFDVDGITATALLVEALSGLGADVHWYIPNRERESHGLHWPSLQPFLGRGVRVLLTCDTGVSSHAAVLQAQKMGLEVIITDHHDLPASLPPALAVVNPKRLDEGHPLRHLSGAGVAYKLAEALEAAERGLDLATLGLIADVVVQVGDVRYLMQRGLHALRTNERVGLKALAEVAELRLEDLNEDDISFALAPRINALGRLADAAVGVQLFLEKDLGRARNIAAEAEALNVRRQFLSKQVTAAAQEQVERDPASGGQPILVLSHPAWPSGVLGIAASRLAERYSRPVVLIAAPPGAKARGSARSVEGVDVRAALAAHEDLLDSFGGHPMAAGFSIHPDRIPELKRRLIRTIADATGVGLAEPELAIGSYISIPELTLHLAEDLGRLAPFGPGNPPVYLASTGLTVTGSRTIGRTGEHRIVELEDEEGHTASAFWWHSSDSLVPEGRFDLAYVLRINQFQRERTLQLEWIDARGVRVALTQPPRTVSVPDVVDYRGLLHSLAVLRALRDEGGMQLWAEAAGPTGLDGLSRFQLRQMPTLAVWTIPPAAQVLAEVLGRVCPKLVYLFANDPGLDVPELFMRRLAGLVKHALEAYGGELRWDSLAAAMAHRVEAVQAGVDWLVGRGQITRTATAPDAVVVSSGGEGDAKAAERSRARLEDLLRETAAYRRYFREAEADSLVLLEVGG